MGRMSWAVYGWPGLPHLWRRGAWSGLAVAVGFAVVLNLALVSSLVWTELELLGAASRGPMWLAVAILWIGSAVGSFGWDRRHPEADPAAREDDTFGEALDHYLQQNWYEAQRSLVRLLRRDPRDPDARLMLATVLRHSGRLDEATGQLDRLGRMEGSRKWEYEIDQQRERLVEAVRPTQDQDVAVDDSPEGEKLAA